MTLPDLIAASTIAVLAVGVSAPALGSALRDRRLDAAARHAAFQMLRARAEAVSRGAYVGIRFERRGAWRLYLDGGARGILSSEIASGVDAPLGPSIELAADHPGIRFGIGGAAPVPRVPPAAGTLAPGADPIAFGGSDIFSASPTGETSGGSLYLTDGTDMRAIVVYGATGRQRLWSYDAATRRWRT